MLSPAWKEKLAELGGRYVSSYPEALFWHVDVINNDIVVQSKALISFDDKLEEELKVQKRLHREGQKKLKDLEDRIDLLYNQLLGKQPDQGEDQNATTSKNDSSIETNIEEKVLVLHEEINSLRRKQHNENKETVNKFMNEMEQMRRNVLAQSSTNARNIANERIRATSWFRFN